MGTRPHVWLALALALVPQASLAMCDVIPGRTKEFRGALGTLRDGEGVRGGGLEG